MNESKELRNAVWFSRHRPTPAQLSDAKEMGYEIGGIDDGIKLGSINLSSRQEVDDIIDSIEGLALDNRAVAVFGVFPPPVLEAVLSSRNLGFPLYSAWNINRSAEGSKPTFEHFVWCQVGWI